METTTALLDNLLIPPFMISKSSRINANISDNCANREAQRKEFGETLTERSGQIQPKLVLHFAESTHQAQVQKYAAYLHLDIKAHVGGALQT
jgi:hypothetical protein